VPSIAPDSIPAALEAGGRYNFEIAGLLKRMPDGSTAKLEVGDTVELFVEVFDKNPTSNRPAGYTKEARRKIVVTEKEAGETLTMWKEERKRRQDKLAELIADQKNVFKPHDEETMPPKK
jgi:hypothetical protein